MTLQRLPPLDVGPVRPGTATVTDSVALGAITLGGGNQVRLGTSGTVYASPQSYTGLSAGSYTGQARRSVTDGHNFAYGPWVDCPTRTITAPAPTIPAGCVSGGGSTYSGGTVGYYAGLCSDISSNVVTNADDPWEYEATWQVRYRGRLSGAWGSWSSIGAGAYWDGRTAVGITPSAFDRADFDRVEFRVQIKNSSGQSSGWSSSVVTIAP